MKKKKFSNPIRSNNRVYLKRIHSGLSCGEDNFEEATVVDEIFKSNHNILKGDESDLLCSNKNFLYCYSSEQLPKILSSTFNLEPYEPSGNSANLEDSNSDLLFKRTFVNEKLALTVDFRLPIFLSVPSSRILVSAYPIKRKAVIAYRGANKPEEIDMLPFMEQYHKYLSFQEMKKRVGEIIQNEWNSLHGNKKPHAAYRDRTDAEFQKEYIVDKFKPRNNGEMQKEWDKLHKGKKIDYLI